MKKLIITVAFCPIFSFAQKKDSVRLKFQYMEIQMLKEQYDTLLYAVSKSAVEMYPWGVAALKIMKNQVQTVNLYDTIKTAPAVDSVSSKPKKLKKK